ISLPSMNSRFPFLIPTSKHVHEVRIDSIKFTEYTQATDSQLPRSNRIRSQSLSVSRFGERFILQLPFDLVERRTLIASIKSEELLFSRFRKSQPIKHRMQFSPASMSPRFSFSFVVSNRDILRMATAPASKDFDILFA